MQTAVILAALTVASASPSAAATVVDQIPGLQAWYTTDSLHAKLRDGDAVVSWPDSSTAERHLASDGDGRPSILESRRIGEHAVVRVGKSNTFSVEQPFDLGDHTIFVVYDSERPRRGLFQGGLDDQESNGIVLRHEGTRELLQLGSNSRAYGGDSRMPYTFNITVLGRESGRLFEFVNGEDLSSGEMLDGTLRVGRFFSVRQTRYVVSDGEGLWVAEMIFYDRFLTAQERSAVARYLSEKYAIELKPQPGATLGTSVRQNVNAADGYFVAWDRQVELEAPMLHDPDNDRTRLRCSRDGTRVRLTVKLSLTSSTPGTDVRVLVLKNGEDYLDQQAQSGVLTGPTPPYAAAVRLEATLTLNDGDEVEIVTFAAGEPGAVHLDPATAELRAEILP